VQNAKALGECGRIFKRDGRWRGHANQKAPGVCVFSVAHALSTAF
jgi:hypothetical protein